MVFIFGIICNALSIFSTNGQTSPNTQPLLQNRLIHEHLEWPDDGSTYEPKHVVNGQILDTGLLKP
jgi:hypothetical protein